MREIKFRAWDKTLRRWKYFTLQELTNGDREDSKVNCDEDLMNWCEFTGLHDKNGKEIYEGDILEFNYSPLGSFREQIGFDDGGFWIKRKEGDRFMPSQEYREIIGNIYSDPHLLNKEK